MCNCNNYNQLIFDTVQYAKRKASYLFFSYYLYSLHTCLGKEKVFLNRSVYFRNKQMPQY